MSILSFITCPNYPPYALLELIQFNLSNFNINLGINWLHACGAKTDCKDLEVIFSDEKSQEVYFYGLRKEKHCPLISIMSKCKQLCLGCIEYWFHSLTFRKKEETTKEISVITSLEMFTKELPRLTPQSEIGYEIN